MASKSSIEWLDGGSTWNPSRGCTPCASECARCFARTFAERWRGVPGHPFEQGFDPRTVPESLDLPLRWKKPRTIFVNSVSDIFHDAFPDDFIDRVFKVMQTARQHRYIVLTKRAERMREFLSSRVSVPWGGFTFPDVRHITVGVSVGTLARLGDIETLRRTPAARRMISFEPLLEDLGAVDLRGIDVAAIGGESGPGARPCDVAWIRSLIAQCRKANCSPFVKQLGSHAIVDYYDDAFRELYEAGGFEWPDPEGWSPCDGQPGIGARVRLRAKGDRKNADPANWTPELRVREFPVVNPEGRP